MAVLKTAVNVRTRELTLALWRSRTSYSSPVLPKTSVSLALKSRILPKLFLRTVLIIRNVGNMSDAICKNAVTLIELFPRQLSFRK